MPDDFLDDLATGGDVTENTIAAAIAAEPAEPVTPAPVTPAAPEPVTPPAAVPPAAPAVPPVAPQMVPHAALHQAREEAKQLKAQLAELQRQRAQPPAAPETPPAPAAEKPKIPDFLQDPKGYIDANLGQTAKQLEKLQETGAQLTAQQQAYLRESNLRTNAQVAEAEFVKTAPDYYQALDFARTVRIDQLKLLNPQAPEIQIRQFVAQEELQLAEVALQTGRNPAELGYSFAKSMGYKGAPTTVVPAASIDPKIEAAKLAAQTLGASSSPDGDTGKNQTESNPNDEVISALAERFGARKKAG